MNFTFGDKGPDKADEKVPEKPENGSGDEKCEDWDSCPVDEKPRPPEKPPCPKPKEVEECDIIECLPFSGGFMRALGPLMEPQPQVVVNVNIDLGGHHGPRPDKCGKPEDAPITFNPLEASYDD